MSTYEDAWSLIGTQSQGDPQAVKETAYNVLNQHSDKLNLSPEEEYSMGWGADALSDAQIAKHAKALTDQINSSQSTQILRNSVKRSNSSATNAQAEAATTATPMGSSGGQGSGSHGHDVANGSSRSGDSDMAANGGLGSGELSDSIKADALSKFKSTLPLGVIPAALAGLVNLGYSQSQALAKINASDDPLGALIDAQKWTPETAVPDANAQLADQTAANAPESGSVVAAGSYADAGGGFSLSQSQSESLGAAMASWGGGGGGGEGGDGGGSATGGNNGDASGGGDRGTRGGF